MNEPDKNEGLYLHEWAYKKAENVWNKYNAWVDRHPKIFGSLLALVMFSMAYDSYNLIPISKYPFMEWFCVFVFILWGFLFLYAAIIYKPKPKVINNGS